MMNIQRLIETLSKITDSRRQWGYLRHNLVDILVIGFLTTICGGEDFTDMEDFGIERRTWLETFLELPNGIPDSDTFRRVFERVDPQELADNLRDWLDIHREQRSVVSIDGKTIRGSKSGAHRAYHVVSAFVSENRITLGEIKTNEKSNEITAVPELLEMLSLEGAIVTADAMSCQTKIAAKITEKQADYVIGLKGNQSVLRDDVELYFRDFMKEFVHSKTLEKGHGRIEEREYFLLTEINWLPQRADWVNLNAIGAVKSTVEEKGTVRTETRFFITSLTTVEEFARSVREHWCIENQLHWCLDVIFREDAARARKDNSPLNMNVMRKTALPLLKTADFGRIGIKKKMFRAALSVPSLEYILSGQK
ncbi:MAG: ISAs1 family transposase [Thermoguttaceae bacterium]